ncbi:HxsD-like protein [bacterium]|nr:HxsD-like protein [bacterium]
MTERITFDRSLYLPEAVVAAAEVYNPYATVAVETAAEATVAVISDAREYDLATVVHAFANHVLYETIARRRQAALDEGAA